ncbi:response regulator [Bdellovibrio sp. SKB1291214]|uniref:response regulator n=1 Tax=Bdellovibrio sp. SKB1291214 TaxID=1732569 RepID=UPI000B5195C7|nr:response regulator [Bdellovibrio sp. SKB1291214]UYL07336.1 response regulator [Bdellovibrio sp. SKB1291214]
MANILIVDDQKSILMTLEALLSSDGHAVVQATNAIDAVHHLTQEKFDLVITDAIMPGGSDGYALTRTIRKQPQLLKLPVVLLTGKREKSDVEKGLEAGVNDYIIKPIDPDMLLAKVRTILTTNGEQGATFIEAPVAIKADWEIKTEIVSVSEMGFTLHSSVAMPLGKILRIKSSIFDDIGIDPVALRIDSCEDLNPIENAYKIHGHFVGIAEKELTPLRLYIRQKQSKAS